MGTPRGGYSITELICILDCCYFRFETDGTLFGHQSWNLLCPPWGGEVVWDGGALFERGTSFGRGFRAVEGPCTIPCGLGSVLALPDTDITAGHRVLTMGIRYWVFRIP